jgi:hypothetical protein
MPVSGIARSGLTIESKPTQEHAGTYFERLIGSIRRECLDHVMVVNEKD